MKKTVALFLILFLVILKSGAQCFTLVYEGNGVDHMNFYFTGATVNGVNLQPGDEIGIFDGNLCVGRATLTQVLTGGVLLPGWPHQTIIPLRKLMAIPLVMPSLTDYVQAGP